jgi:hypothetical protein
MMDFTERIAPEINRGLMRNPDDEAISRLEQEFLQVDGQGAKTEQ